MRIGDIFKNEIGDSRDLTTSRARVLALVVNPDRIISDVYGITIRSEVDSAIKELEGGAWTREAKLAAFTIATYINNLPPVTNQKLPVGNDDTIASLELSVRPDNCLYRAGIKTISELVTWSPKELSDIRSLGLTSLSEIRRKLANLGLTLKGETLEQ